MATMTAALDWVWANVPWIWARIGGVFCDSKARADYTIAGTDSYVTNRAIAIWFERALLRTGGGGHNGIHVGDGAARYDREPEWCDV
jgi:hypothetical protein